MPMLNLLLVATFLLTLYDFRYRIVPNWVTLPIMVMGIILHFPGVPEVWIGSLILVLFGFLGGGRIGFGDVKLWLAYFWILPLDVAGIGTLVGFQVILVTALAQVAYFRLRKISTPSAYPAVWRVFVSTFVVFMIFYTGIFRA